MTSQVFGKSIAKMGCRIKSLASCRQLSRSAPLPPHIADFTENLETGIHVDENLARAALLTDEEIFDSVKKNEEEQGGEEDDV
ncbi:unnamed protein product [Parnassius apollo]|uniref:(apollo) hypothetical protein n=1 Tax=Parnassius apollo TaxID=110799 RepID=A0A8S3VZ89_PARAO|nr:unnamed protein product [Parnassius apollo]